MSRGMKKFLDRVIVMLVIFGTIVAVALGLYIIGRILLPEMSLTAPGYGTWFWATLWSAVFGSALWWFYNRCKFG